MTNQNEVDELVKLVDEARLSNNVYSSAIEQLRNSAKAIKTTNDERLNLFKAQIDAENSRVNDILFTQEKECTSVINANESTVQEVKGKLLRRIHLCQLKNLLKTVTVVLPKDALYVMYKGVFCVVYDEIKIGDKPVNRYEWHVKVDIANAYFLRDLLKVTWSKRDDLNYSFDGDATFFQRDFSSEADVKAYAERNRLKICRGLVDSIQNLQDEIKNAEDNINNVFDFRLITEPYFRMQYARDTTFKVISVEPHKLVLSPALDSFSLDKSKSYQITVVQADNMLTISGHHLSGEARQIKSAVNRYFTSEFVGVEADTGQQIDDPHF
ncbi:MAG: hypothetical protein WC325_10825 [Candidatus Bathyarchaeia archaeon]|jgi:hypothetical protein